MLCYILSYEYEDLYQCKFNYYCEKNNKTISIIQNNNFHSFLLELYGLDLRPFYFLGQDILINLLIKYQIKFEFDSNSNEIESINKNEKNWNEFLIEFNDLLNENKNENENKSFEMTY